MATTQTPERRGVRWAFDVANSPFGGAAEPSTPETSTSSLAYVNSQIIAHGFARVPLDLSELGREEQNRVVKCVLGMLSQRVNDMTRAEDLSSRLRTVSYEHERLSNMLRAAKNEVLQAEREAEAAKTKANSLIKDLSAASTSHNRTSAQLAQSTSAVAALRAASAADTRKREQDLAKLKERWQRLAAEQAKLGTVGSGMVCSNWAVAVNEQYVGMKAEGEEAAEGAMRDAIEARERLAETNDEFREVFVKLVNVVGEGLREKEVPDVKLPTPASLFTPPAIEDDAGPALNAYRTLRDLIQQLASAGSTHSPDKEIAAREAERAKQEQHRQEIRGWEEKVEKLEREMAKLKGELAASNDFCEKSRLLIAQMVNDKKEQEKNVEEHNTEEATSLAEQRQQLEEERAKFTDAAIRLARERSDFEVERLALAEEKRQWAARQLEEPVPAPGPVITVTAPESDAPSSPIPTHEPDHPPQPPTDTEDEPAPVENTLAGQLRMALKAAKAAESGDRTRKKGKTAAKKDKDKPKPKEKPKTKEKDKAQVKDKPLEAEKENVASGSGSGSESTVPDPFRPAPKIPTTPRSLHPAAQRARARNYAPAVPSPLSRIISMAVSPEKNEVEEVVQLPSKMTMTLRSSTSGKGKGGSRSPKAGSSRSPKAAGKSPKARGSESPPRATGSIGGGSLAEKFAAAAAKDKSKADKGKGKEVDGDKTVETKTQEEKEKEEGRDLDVIFAAPKEKKKKAAGPSRAGGSKVPLPSGKPLRVPVVAKRALMTPRKAPLGGVRAKRGAWKG